MQRTAQSLDIWQNFCETGRLSTPSCSTADRSIQRRCAGVCKNRSLGWQHGAEPRILENPEPSLAVARGAAHFGKYRSSPRSADRSRRGARNLFGSPQKRFRKQTVSGPLLICILPGGAPSEEDFQVSPDGLELRLNRPVRFQPYYSARRTRDKAGSVVPWNDRDFHSSPATANDRQAWPSRPRGRPAAGDPHGPHQRTRPAPRCLRQHRSRCARNLAARI